LVVGAVFFVMRLAPALLLTLALCSRGLGADTGIRFLEERVKKDPGDFTAQNMLGARYLDLLRNTGDDEWLAKARRASEVSVSTVPPEINTAGLALRARVQLASHQFSAARDGARRLVEMVPQKAVGYSILGDALLELGGYAEAAEAYQKLAQLDEGGIDSESRLARLSFIRGDLAASQDHFVSALAQAAKLSPASTSLVAWCSVQLGQLYFGRGDWGNAGKQYDAALKAVPDYYAALDHLAELRAAQEKYPEAIQLYEKVIAFVPRPEFVQALGDVYVFMNKPQQAKPWHERAVGIYLKSATTGDARFFHHLAGFYCDSMEEPAEALKWARKDLEIRQSIFAHDALAWSLYRNGEFREAAEEMKKALSLGTRDAHLLFHASMIASANGNLGQGKEFLRLAAEVNPHYHAFHVHR
jgi:tetratricopeptide (TPR) repeat protein